MAKKVVKKADRDWAKGQIIGRAKTHPMGKATKDSDTFTTTFTKKSRGVVDKVANPDEVQPGQQPLTRVSDSQKPMFMKAAQDVNELREKKGVIFSLTGGYYPTFTEMFREANAYTSRASAFVMVNEGFNASGPAPIMLRGNHVWYKYATDWLQTTQTLRSRLMETGASLGPPKGVMSELFKAYNDNVKKQSKPLMRSWRTMVAGKVSRKAKSQLLSESEGKIDVKDAPEESLPALIADPANKGLMKEHEIEIVKMAKESDAQGVDMVFKVGGKLYAIDTSQSKIEASATHASVGKFSSDVKKYQGENVDAEAVLRTELTAHYQKSSEAINTAIELMVEIHKKYGEEGDSVRDTAAKAGIKWRQPWQRKFDRQLRANNAAKKKGKTAKKVTGKGIQDILEDGKYKLKKEVLDRYALRTEQYMTKAFEQALHIIGNTGTIAEAQKSGGHYSDILIIEKFGDGEETHAPVGINFRMELIKGIEVYKITLDILETDILLELDYQFYMQYIMDDVMDLGEKAVIALLEKSNALWLLAAIHAGVTEISTGQVISIANLLYKDSYTIAGGALVFEPKTVHEEIINFLDSILNDKAMTPASWKREIWDNLQKQTKPAVEAFSSAFAKVNSNLMQTEKSQPNENNQELAEQMIYNNPINSGKNFEGAGDAQRSGLNPWLKSKVWARPYVGIYYQGGKSSDIKQNIMN